MCISLPQPCLLSPPQPCLLSPAYTPCLPACPPRPPARPAVMQRAGGKDIVKKSSSRKGRYLLAFNFQLAPAAAGKLVRALHLLRGLRSAHARGFWARPLLVHA